MALRRLLLPPSATAIVGLALLTGCGDDPVKPKPFDPSEQTSSTTSPTARASPTEPATPKPRTPEDTIREFVRVQTEMERTGDASDFRAMGYRCEYCRKYSGLVEGIYERGGVLRTAGWTIRSLKPQPVRVNGLRSFDVVVDEAGASYRWEKGAPIKRDRARKGARYVFDLRQYDGVWKVTLVGTEK